MLITMLIYISPKYEVDVRKDPKKNTTEMFIFNLFFHSDSNGKYEIATRISGHLDIRILFATGLIKIMDTFIPMFRMHSHK